MKKKDSIKRRIKVLQSELRQRDFDFGVVIKDAVKINPSNFFYLFDELTWNLEYSALLLDTERESLALVTEFSQPRIEELGWYDYVHPVKQSTIALVKSIKEIILSRRRRGKIGVDFSSINAKTGLLLGKALAVPTSPEYDISEIIENQRLIKDHYEVGQIEEAIGMAEAVMAEVTVQAKPGDTEEELKREVYSMLIRKGAVELSFDTIIGFGEGYYSRFYPPSVNQLTLTEKDLTLVDMGAKIKSGYCSDLTRTIPCGVNPKFGDLLDATLQVSEQGVKFIKDGVHGIEIYRKVADMIHEFGYEVKHRHGHQIGLDDHDPLGPNLGNDENVDQARLREGMTVTFEPGLFDTKNRRAARFENIVFVQKNRCKILNSLPLKLW